MPKKQRKIKRQVKDKPYNAIDSAIFNNINVGIYRNTPGPKGRFIKANAALFRMFGYKEKSEHSRLNTVDLYVYPRQRKSFSDQLLKKGFVKRKELLLKRKDGSVFYAHVTAVVVKDKNGKPKWFDGIVEDVTESKKEQERFKLIFEHSPIAIWEEDFSSFAALLRKIRKKKIQNIRQYLTKNPKVIIDAFRKIRVLDVNKAGLVLYGASSKKELKRNFGRTFTKGILKVLIDEFVALAKGDRFFEKEIKARTLDHKLYDALLRVSIPAGYEKSLKRVIVTLQDITPRKKLERHLKEIAQRDGLTKLLNYRTMCQRLEEEFIRAKRYNLDLSCLMIDVDRFKRINDTCGHQKGDHVLKRIARLIKKSMRRSDIIGRYGGDEFLVILTETKPANAEIAAERIRRLIEQMKLNAGSAKISSVTVSMGVSGYPSKDIKKFRDLIARSDKALYSAKKAGRNCVFMSKTLLQKA